MKTQKFYSVNVSYGDIHDLSDDVIFYTLDKNKAEKWVKRALKIIEDNKDRIRTAEPSNNQDWFLTDYIYESATVYTLTHNLI